MLSKKDIKSLNVGIVYSRFNEPVVKELLNSCVDQLILEGIDENHIQKKRGSRRTGNSNDNQCLCNKKKF